MKRLIKLSYLLKSLNLITESRLVIKLSVDSSGLNLSWLQQSSYLSKVDMDQFLVRNLEELKKIDSLAKGRYSLISSGGEGTAYVIGDSSPEAGSHSVLKIDFSNYLDKKDSLEADLANGSTDYEVSILDWGTLEVPYSNDKVSKVLWKVVEKVETPSLLDLGIQDLIDAILQDLADRKKDLEISRAKNPRDRAVAEGAYYDLLNPDNVVDLLSSGISSEELSMKISSMIRGSGILDSTISSLDEILSDGWLEDFIKSILYLMGERGKNDLGGDNVGIRTSTGRLVWFDA